MSRERSIVRVSVRGRVQGVWFRDWTRRTATGLGLSGWVRNRRDGSVEALFAGAPESVAAMLERCRVGPPLARVDEVALLPEEADAAPAGFDILPTA